MHVNIPVSLKMTIDLANILDRNCPLQSIKISKFSGGAGPQSSLAACVFSVQGIHH